MNVSVHLETAPPLASWQSVLTAEGWKIIDYTTETLEAKTEYGESKFPVRNATTWRLRFREDGGDGVSVKVSVPAFAESDYARQRLLETIDDFADRVDGHCETSASLSVDVLGNLRTKSDSYPN